MNLENWLAFLMVALLTTFSPGPALLLTLSNSASQGIRQALLAVVGNVMGVVTVSCVCALGLNIILQTSAQAFWLVKLIGALYLIYLGVNLWRSRGDGVLTMQVDAQKKEILTLVLKSYLTAITNPKAILFFSALFPQFMSSTGFDGVIFAQLTAVFTACVVLAHVVYAWGTAWIMNKLSQGRIRQWFQRALGAIFVLLGLSLLKLKQKLA